MSLLLAAACAGPTIDDGTPGTHPAELGTVALVAAAPGGEPVWVGDAVIALPEDVDRLAPYVGITGDLVVEDTALVRVELPALRVVDGEVRVWENAALGTLSLPALRVVGGDLSLYDDPVLGDLGGLSSVTTVGGTLSLNRLPALTDLAGLERVEQVGALYVFHDLGLRTLDGLDALAVVDGEARLWEDEALEEARLPALRQVTGTLDVFDARSLLALELPALTELGGLEEKHCDLLVDAGSFPLLTSVEGEVWIHYDPVQTSLAGLEGLTHVRALTLEHLEALTDTSALDGLTTVDHGLTAEHLDALVSLGLGAVETAGVVDVRFDPVLADLGLGALLTAAAVDVEHDPALPDCAVEALLERVEAPLETCSDVLDAGCATLCTP